MNEDASALDNLLESWAAEISQQKANATMNLQTPAGGGNISPAAEDRSTSHGSRFSGGASAVNAPPKPEDFPVEAGADEIDDQETFEYSLACPAEDDDTDEVAFPRSRNVIFSISSAGEIIIRPIHGRGVVLTAAQARTLHKFLSTVARIGAEKQ